MSLARLNWEVVSGKDARLALKWWASPAKLALMPLTGYAFSLALCPRGSTAPTKTLTTANGGIVISSITDGTPPAAVDALLTFKINDEDAEQLPVGLYEGKLMLSSGSENVPQLIVSVNSIA